MNLLLIQFSIFQLHGGIGSQLELLEIISLKGTMLFVKQHSEPQLICVKNCLQPLEFQQHPSAPSHVWRYTLKVAKSGPEALLHIKTGNKWNFKLKFVPVGNVLLLLPITTTNFGHGVLCRVLSYTTTSQWQRGLF